MQSDMRQPRARVHAAFPPNSFTLGHYRNKLCMRAALPLKAYTFWLLSDYQPAKNITSSSSY